jgi:cyclic pyranopterin phosphate synthase
MAFPKTGPLIDTFDRVADDLRISVTDRCNFRCVYCMPEEGMEWLHRAKLLRFEEIAAVVKVFVGLGVRTLRLTGGEPTLRKDLPVLVEMLRDVDPSLDLAMTTNGFLLERLAGPLRDAGLRRINVSIDSLLRHRFAEITRRDALEQVMRGLEAAEEAGLEPIKINCVVVRGTNEDEILDFVRLARSHPWEVRFIEFMPLDADRAWTKQGVFTQEEILRIVTSVYPLEPEMRGLEPAGTWRFADGAPGRIGVIASVSEPFCDSCNRIRLTADGQLRTCLFSLHETDLRAIVRNGGSEGDLEEAIRSAVWAKEEGHRIGQDDFVRPERSMSMIGG